MATIVVTALPSSNALVSGWPAPRQPAAGDDGAVLEEAIRFHDFTSAQIKKAGDFRRFDADELARSLSGLRWQLHDVTLEHLARLMSRVDAELTPAHIQSLLLETLPAAVAKRRRGVPGADRGRAAVRVLVSPDWRNPERDRLLTQHRGSILIRRFEQLHSALEALHILATRPAIEQALTSSFGPDIVAPWGGDKAVARAGRADSSAPGGGYANLGETGVGLTEKLYEQFATQAFKKAHAVATLKPREIPASVAGGPPFRLHLDIRKSVEAILREILPGSWKEAKDLPKPYGLWHKNLDALEARFLHACLLPGPGSNAIALGFPWAVALTSVLRVYLTELVGRLLTVALPVQLGYAENSGYLGVALWEAIAGQDAPHATRLGYLVPRPLAETEIHPPTGESKSGETPANGGHPQNGGAADAGGATPAAQPTPDPLLKALKDWRIEPFIRGWSQTVAHHQRLVPLLEAMAKEPCLIARKDPKAKEQQKLTATLTETHAGWPRFPVCRFPGARFSEVGLDLYCGAYLTAQCHLFVADQILRVAIDDLGMPRTWSDKRRDEGDAVELKARPPTKPSDAKLTPAIEIIAGSYLWGGSHPPHITHRDGATFDLRFGADTVAWLPEKGSKKIDEAIREAGLGTKRRPYTDLEGVCLTRAQQDAKQPTARIFRSLMRELIRQEFRRIYEPLRRSPAKPEVAIYSDVETRLAGTPHFSATGSAQQVQAGHIALLLSAPTQVIFSSPISHLRAMRAVRFGLTGVGKIVITKAADALQGALFVFKPTDHWHHWHVQYSVPGGSGLDPKPAVDRWTSFLPLWRELGVNLEPFATYLKDLQLAKDGDLQVARVRAERDLLLDELDRYSPVTDGRDHLRKLFMRLSRNDPDGLLKPANASRLSVALRAAADESDGILTRLITRALIDKVRTFLEAIGPEDLTFGGGDPTRERRD
jgi:hypothetical protein